MFNILLLQAVIYSRILHIYYQHCHNLTYGSSFVGDHTVFNDFYEEVADNYDRLSEYTVSQFGNKEFNTTVIHESIMEELQNYKVENMTSQEMFNSSLILEFKFYNILKELDIKASIGLKNMIGDFAEKSDVRQYKIKQRLK